LLPSKTSRVSIVVIVTRRQDGSFDFWQRQEIFLSFKSSILVLGPNPAPIQSTQQIISLGIKRLLHDANR